MKNRVTYSKDMRADAKERKRAVVTIDVDGEDLPGPQNQVRITLQFTTGSEGFKRMAEFLNLCIVDPDLRQMLALFRSSESEPAPK